MNAEPRPSLRPLICVVVLGALVAGLMTATRGGLVEVTINWPQDQPGPPLLAAAAIVSLFLFVVYVFLSARRSPSQPSEPPATPGPPRPPGRPTRMGLITERPPTRFSDVAGAEEAKEELAEVVDFLRAPERFTAVGARIPRGVLLVGPPGNGKTLLARAVAGEAGVPFLRASGSEFVEMYVGVGAARVRDLFKSAREHGRSIVFLDEIDAVGRRRGGPSGHAHEEREQTLNQLLVEMDGFDARSRVIVLAATNRPDVLDPALLRPGRFDRQVQLDPPDAAGRRQILALHARDKPLAEGASTDSLVSQTAGLSGADLENLLNEAAILTARGGRDRLEQHDLEEALDRVVAGPRRKGRAMSERERRITAVHELGHALVAHLLPDADPVQKVTIVSRGQMGGYTRMAPAEDRRMWSLAQFEAAMAAALGGHVAEALVFRQVTTGASNDLRRAASIARAMVCEYGMSPILGALAVGGDEEARLYRPYGEHLAQRIDAEVQRLVAEAQALADALLAPRLASLERAAERLLEVETINATEVARLFGPQLAAVPSIVGDGGPAQVAASVVAPLAPEAPPTRRFWRPSLSAALPFTLRLRWRRGQRKQSRPALA
ncbi:MAG TPA: ATP-dependent zinc metalloprotease FtsH [Chloroflexota bacterium]|nr:ATP-dependent zinc metalloprotease FtsH [Chloroflexota bacterium]